MEKIVVSGWKGINEISIYLDRNYDIVVLPTLWAIRLSLLGKIPRQMHVASRVRKKSVIQGQIKNDFLPNYVSDRNLSDVTSINYIYYLNKFLAYLEDFESDSEGRSPHLSHLCNSKTLNTYLNSYLAEKVASVSTLEANAAAINSYFLFLESLGVINSASVGYVFKETRHIVSSRADVPANIKYVTLDERKLLRMSCKNLSQRLYLRLGYEVGLRTKECTGFRLDTRVDGKNKRVGLLDLFKDKNKNLNKKIFKFWISGIYTKGGLGRDVYLSREILNEMEKYYKESRNKNYKYKSKTLFIREDRGGAGMPISEDHASRKFLECKERARIDREITFHNLRHTFATEYLESEMSNNMDSKGALLRLQEILGHRSDKSTKQYLRLRQQVNELERI